jgi:hypothetical protein
VVLLTSRKDVTDTYGIPKFTANDGTVQQGDELNEVGLYGLYDALGNSSLAYAIRADIDLKQLKSTQEEPAGKVANQTLWFDMASTSYGLFRANGNSRAAVAWDRIDQVLVPEDSDLDENFKPVSTFGNNGSIAIVSKNNKQIIYENIASEWFEIGSKEWVAQFPSSARGTRDGTYESGAKITINGVEVELTGNTVNTKIEDAIVDINAANIENIVAKEYNGALLIEDTAGQLSLSQDSKKALETLGFKKLEDDSFKIDSVSIVYKTHSQVPSGINAGSIWVKTTEPNYGAKYVMKQYNSRTDSWTSTYMNMYGSLIEAEQALGTTLNASSLIVKYDDESLAETRILQYGSQNLKITGTESNPVLTKGQSILVKTLVGTDIKTYKITAIGNTVESFVKAFNSAKITTLVADVTPSGNFRIVSSTGNTVEMENINGGEILNKLGIAEGENGKWLAPEYTASQYELSTDASIGTYWFNDELNVDIMVNDGSKWLGYKNMYDCTEIFKSSNEPTAHADGSNLVENDLWINTASDEYPEIYRYYDNNWELIDNTDQSTPLGIVFADARENAGPVYNGSHHVAFSTNDEDLLISDYVDPNCVNPLTYPAGILLFNTLYSTNNVKEFVDEYKDYTKNIGSKYTVGNSEEFATPGSNLNPKTTRWQTASGNATDGAGLFGRRAQRAMVVKALAKAVNSNEEIRSADYDFFFACCPGYPELDDELIALNTEKSDMFYIVSDTPARLAPKGNDINAWGSNKNNASSHGEKGRVLRSAYMSRQYPPMGLTSNIDGSEIAIPTSIVKMKNLLVLPRGMIAAGTQYGQVSNVSSVGYINDEDEYDAISLKEGLGEVIVGQSINPIMPIRNAGLLLWGENTENSYTSSLSDEHTIITLLRLKRELQEACLPFFWRPNTATLRNDFDSVLRSILNDYVSRDELYDYVLVTDSSVNTAERIERKELWADISIEATKGVEQIYLPIRIVKTGSLSSSD